MLYSTLLDFSEKHVVLTGGFGQIGFAVARVFLAHGATVVIADVDGSRLSELQAHAVGGRCSFVPFDIAQSDAIPAMVEGIIAAHPRIHAWVNLAYPRSVDWGNTMEDVTVASWDANIRAHLGGYFWTSRCILEHMQRQGGGSLINFGSTYGVVGPHFGVYEGTDMTMPVAYAAIKGAIVNLTRYFAARYGPYNVRVNTICPGGVFNHQDPRFVKRYETLTPLGRMARAEEVALPTVFLASDAASYITGHTLMVDGGWTAW